MSEIEKTQKHEEVSQYYGETLEHSGDLKTNACCILQSYPVPASEVDRASDLSCLG